jgi:hypothetical protein
MLTGARVVALCLGCVLLSASLFAQQSGSATAIAVTDIMPDFWAFWSHASGKPLAEQMRLFHQGVIAKHPELFAESVTGVHAEAGQNPEQALDHKLTSFLTEIVPYIPAMKTLSAQLNTNLQEYARDFRQQFPDYESHTAVYFTISLWAFDGGTREVNGKTALLFGVDAIARIHGANANLKVLFDHELFHQYHYQIVPAFSSDNAPLWMSLWEEGLATYVSQRMNPGASEQQVLMFPPDLAERSAPILPKLARELYQNRDSTSDDVYAAFFYAQNKRNDLPPRSGYYVGYRVAKKLCDGHALDEIAHWQGDELKKKVEAALEEFAVEH